MESGREADLAIRPDAVAHPGQGADPDPRLLVSPDVNAAYRPDAGLVFERDTGAGTGTASRHTHGDTAPEAANGGGPQPAPDFSLDALARGLERNSGLPPAAQLRLLLAEGLDRLPLPGAGRTLLRWRALALVGAHDLSLAKLYEGHTDALAIRAELGTGGRTAAPSQRQGQGAGGAADVDSWGVWCAEPPDARLQLVHDASGTYVAGRKAWCSGAQDLTHALVSCWDSAGQACLAAVDLRQDGVTVTAEGWQAVGMRGSASVDVLFDRVPARAVGLPGAYVGRPGFWHGGAGVAACWYGAAAALGDYLRRRCLPAAPANHAGVAGSGPDASPDHILRLAQLGEIDATLSACAALLRSTAAAIDASPLAAATPGSAPGAMAYSMADTMRVRLAVEEAATRVLALATRALGAGPLCKDGRFAQLVADLPVFMRQSHGQRDYAALGRQAASLPEAPWRL